MTEEVVVLRRDVSQSKEDIKELRTKVASIEETLHKMSIAEIEQTQFLKELIIDAVEKGNEKTLAAHHKSFSKVYTAFEELKQESGETQSFLLKEVRKIKQDEAEKELKILKAQQEERKETRKHSIRTIVTVVLTFLLTLLLNNITSILFAYTAT